MKSSEVFSTAPPALRSTPAVTQQMSHIMVVLQDRVIASADSWYLAERPNGARGYYLPSAAAKFELKPNERVVLCDEEGMAVFFDLDVESRHVPNVAWQLALPTHRYAALAGHIAFDPARIDGIVVGGIDVRGPAAGIPVV